MKTLSLDNNTLVFKHIHTRILIVTQHERRVRVDKQDTLETLFLKSPLHKNVLAVAHMLNDKQKMGSYSSNITF